MKDKTAATWLALLGGPFGLHRFYLAGSRDPLGWLLMLPSALGLYGVWRARHWGLDDTWSWALMPLLGITASGCALTAIVYGLSGAERWNARFNPDAGASDGAGATTWLTVSGVVLALFGGTIALMATLAFSFQRLFEFQAL